MPSDSGTRRAPPAAQSAAAGTRSFTRSRHALFGSLNCPQEAFSLLSIAGTTGKLTTFTFTTSKQVGIQLFVRYRNSYLQELHSAWGTAFT